MKYISSLLKKTGLLFVVGVTLYGCNVLAQTSSFTQPSGAPPSSNIPTLLNIGSSNQTMAGSLWANSLGASTFSIGSYVWDLEGGLDTIHTQQLCVSGNCITSFPTTGPHASIATNGSTCGGGWCYSSGFNAAYICQMHGYTHLTGTLDGGGEGNACGWSPTTSSWRCDSSCKSNCNGTTLTAVFCDDNGTSRLQ